MKKLLVMMLVVAMSVTMLAGCNTNANGEATGQNTETESVSDSEEIVSEEVSELTLEEKIAAEMPAKLEVGEDEIIVPETVTAEQIMAKWEEIKVTEGEYAEDINKENLYGTNSRKSLALATVLSDVVWSKIFRKDFLQENNI